MNSLRKLEPLGLLWTLGVAVLLGACSTAPAPAEEVQEALALRDGLDREVTFQEPAERIVSVAASNTEILYAIGAGEHLVGRDEFSDYPAQALDLPDVGGGWGELNTEALVALEPDLVLAAEIHTEEQVQALEGLDLRVFLVPNPESFEDLFMTMEDLGQVTGHSLEAQAAVADLRTRVAAVSAALEGAEPVKVFYEVDATDPNAPFTTGSGTFQDLLIELAGGENIAGMLEGWAQFSLEELVSSDPDVILFAAAPWIPTTPESMAQRTGWGELSAILKGAVYGIDTDWVDLPGPRLVDGLEAFARAIHPERFE